MRSADAWLPDSIRVLLYRPRPPRDRPCERHFQPICGLDLAAIHQCHLLGEAADHLIHDRDAVYGKAFGAKLEGLGVTDIRTPVRAPNANAVAERFVRTLRQECLDHVIVVNERHLLEVLSEFTDYYNSHRPHRRLDLEPPLPTEVGNRDGRVESRSVLGGLHHAYARAA